MIFLQQSLNYGIALSGDEDIPVVLGNATQLNLMGSEFTISVWVYIPTCG